MGSINVAKGLFRLWMVFAMCWVVPATAINFDNLTATRVWKQDLYDDTSGTSFGGQIRIRDPSTLPIGSVTLTAPIWAKRVTALEWIMLPPFVLLMLGYGVLWAVRGFKE